MLAVSDYLGVLESYNILAVDLCPIVIFVVAETAISILPKFKDHSQLEDVRPCAKETAEVSGHANC